MKACSLDCPATTSSKNGRGNRRAFFHHGGNVFAHQSLCRAWDLKFCMRIRTLTATTFPAMRTDMLRKHILTGPTALHGRYLTASSAGLLYTVQGGRSSSA
jgi:hypothetical protein